MSTAQARVGPVDPVGPSAAPRLNAFERWAWAAFGPHLRPSNDARLGEALLRAHWRATAEEFRATRLGIAAVTGAVLTALTFGVLLLPRGTFGSAIDLPVALVVGVVGALGAYAVVSLLPSSRAGDRGRAIDRSLGNAMNFLAALSCADLPVDALFRELADQGLYGEVAAEAAWIVRDCDLLGLDILSALRAGARRSPSVRWQEFLQGVVTTAESGGELRPYLLAQAERFERMEGVVARGQLERLGVLAEAYVAVAVAFPLFLLVLLTVFTLIEGSSSRLILFVWLTALLVIPAAELGFAAVFQSYREGA